MVENSVGSQRDRRRDLISRLQAKRGDRLVIVYITSTRSGHEIQIADDVLRILFDHLEAGKKNSTNGVDLFVHSNGGSGTVPWRIVSLIREYTNSFAVLVPHRAFSAATLIAMGADEIVMHRMGCLGPIDPSVANVFNPPHPNSPGQLAQISVEDVTAYLRLVKDVVGITHEDELIQAFTALTDKIHPLALGNVQRSHNQARMMAKKLLRKHMTIEQQTEHEIDQIIDNLKSNLFYHGHPINRVEANKDLGLKITTPQEDLELLMWELYTEYEKLLNLSVPFNVLHEWELHSRPPAAVPLTTKDIVKQLGEMAQAGIGVNSGIPEEQLIKLAAAMIPFVNAPVGGDRKVHIEGIPGAIIESISHANIFKTDINIERTVINTSSGPQEAVKQEAPWQRWEIEQ